MSGRERELLLDAFDSNWIAPLGPHVDGFEREFAEKVGVSNAVALSSGTAALHLAMILIGVEPGDTVLTSSFTFVATANAIRYCNAQPVFIDSDRQTWNMDPNLLEEELRRCRANNEMPKAVLAVDIVGQCANYDAIEEICRRYEVPLLEDAAESLGATYNGRSAGQFGEIACFSFNGNKIITTSGGGMMVTENKAWADRARFLSTQARDEAPHYQHSVIGFNYRMSNLLAAVGRGQLSVLDDRVNRRREIFDFYAAQLSPFDFIEFMPEPDGYRSTRWLTSLLVHPNDGGITRETMRLALAEHNIEARPLWKPMHLQPAFADCRIRGGAFSESLFDQGLCLPSGSNLTDHDLERIVTILKPILEGVRT
jgi:dTDP-4-amino-4,6-dideoxygalactose transaminase